MWVIPLIVSVLAVTLFITFALIGNQEGATPVLFLLCLAIIAGSWSIYGLWHLVKWIFT